MEGGAAIPLVFVNGGQVEPGDISQPLVKLLREELRLTGTKDNCTAGCTGACTVLLSTYRNGQFVHKSVSSCRVPVAALHLANVTTIEHLGTVEAPHPLQTRLADCHGVQCGYDSPGIVMSMYGLLVTKTRFTLTDIRQQLAGNLSRCTGYRAVLEAFRPFAGTDTGEHRERLEAGLGALKSCPQVAVGNFVNDELSWHLAASEQQAAALLMETKGAKVVHGISVAAGCHEGTVVDVSRLVEDTVHFGPNGLEVGGAVTLHQLTVQLDEHLEQVKETNRKCELMELSRAVGEMGSNQFQSGTAMGDAVASRPDLRVMLSALNAKEKIIKSLFIPWCSMDEFFLMYKSPNGLQILWPNLIVAAKITRAKDNEDLCTMVFGSSDRGEKKITSKINFSGIIANKQNQDEMTAKAVLEVLKPFESSADELLKNVVFKLVQDACQLLTSTCINEQILFYKNRMQKLEKMQSTQVNEIRFFGTEDEVKPLCKPVPHVSARRCTTGEAVFLNDMPSLKDELFMAFVLSKHSHAEISEVDASDALQVTGVKKFITFKDVPDGLNCFEYSGLKDDLIFAEDKVFFEGQPIGAVLATSEKIARKAVKLVKVEYKVLQPVSSLDQAIESSNFIPSKNDNFPDALKHSSLDSFSIGDNENTFKNCQHIVEGEMLTTRQEHFYEETYGTYIVPTGEEDEVHVHCTVPTALFLQMKIATILGVAYHKVILHIKRMGCNFGGKVSRGIGVSLATALAVKLTKSPVRFVFNRDEDMKIMGQRGNFDTKYKLGVSEGKILAVQQKFRKNAGWNSDSSTDIVCFALLHSDNCYKFPAFDVSGRAYKTNTPSNTAFRGYGAPPALSAVENMMFDGAVELNLDPVQFRRQNFYKAGDATHFGQLLTENDVTVEACLDQCIEQSKYYEEKKLVDAFNKENKWKKRGIYIVPNRYGIGMAPVYAQAGALIHVYLDGSVMLYIGGVECGQGLFTKMIQIASQTLGVSMNKIRLPEAATDKIPTPTLTGGSTTADLCGNAVKDACENMNKLLTPFKEAAPKAPWEQWIQMAFASRTNLSATGFYAMDEALTNFDFEKKTGNRWAYFTNGAACTLVEIDVLTGEHKILKTTIVMDLGKSLNPAIDITQIEGAFVQGYGYLVLEDTTFDKNGLMKTTGTDTYRMPTMADIPPVFNVSLLKGRETKRVLYSSKGVGEPAFLYGVSVYFAIKDSILAARQDAGVKGKFNLPTPTTPDIVQSLCLSSPFAKV